MILGCNFTMGARFSPVALMKLLKTDKTTNLQLRKYFETGELTILQLVQLRDLLVNGFEFKMIEYDFDTMSVDDIGCIIREFGIHHEFTYEDQIDGSTVIYHKEK